MKKVLVLACYYLGIWGILGFFATLFLGLVSCCIGLSENFFIYSLIGVAFVGVIATFIKVSKGCKCLEDISL